MELLSKQSIMEACNGAFMEQVDYEAGKVFDNIFDPNTKATKARKITVTLEIIPDNDRQRFTVNTVAKSTLVPINPVTTTFCVATDGNGEMAIVEMVPQVPGQLAMDGEEQKPPKVLNFQKRA